MRGATSGLYGCMVSIENGAGEAVAPDAFVFTVIRERSDIWVMTVARDAFVFTVIP